MKHPTSHLKTLEKNVKKVSKICNRVNRMACRNDLDELKVQSLIVFAHAAIEEYFEEVVLDAARFARSTYVLDSRITKTLVALISASLLDEPAEKQARRKVEKQMANSIEAFSAASHAKFVANVRNNNGIKGKDLRNLLYPIGVDPEEIDLATFNALDAFGTKRGSIAHSRKIVKIHTRSEIESDLKGILAGIYLFDRAVCGAVK